MHHADQLSCIYKAEVIMGGVRQLKSSPITKVTLFKDQFYSALRLLSIAKKTPYGFEAASSFIHQYVNKARI